MIWLLLIVAAFFTVMLARTLRFTPQEEQTPALPEETFDEAAAVEALQALIRCRTVSGREKADENDGEFQRFEKELHAHFPHVSRQCAFHKPGPRSLVFHWKGCQSDQPGVLMAHYDVVPAREDAWEKPPFEAVIEDGVLWGRGTLDTKTTLLGVMAAADRLIEEGFAPENDLYLAFAGDEEISGTGAPTIVNWLAERHVAPAFVLDEGGAVVENVFPGVTRPLAVVGVAEKGYADVRLIVDSMGGHASTPPPRSAIGVLAGAVGRVERKPFPFTLTLPTREMFNRVGRSSSFFYRMIFANLWCFAPVLNLFCRLSGGELNALARTTVAFTRMQGSSATNVFPPRAWIGANLRLVPGETAQSIQAHLERVIADRRVQVEVTLGSAPSPVSRMQGEAWERLAGTIRSCWDDVIVSPYLMMACSDARHYGAICDHVYRFSAMALSKEERAAIHGNNEKIPLETVRKTVMFYMKLIRQC